MLRLLPANAAPDARLLVTSRALRGFADGVVSVVLASYLAALGLSSATIGALATATLVGSAAATLAVGLVGHRIRRRRLLLAAAGLMLATGVAFGTVTALAPLFVVAFLGTLNPTAGDVSVFLPTEQAVLADCATREPSGAGRAGEAVDRTALFARYNLAGTFASALGSLASGLVPAAAALVGASVLAGSRVAFLFYGAVGLAVALVYRRLSPAADGVAIAAPRAPLSRSRRMVLVLSALFSLDSASGGLVVQSLLALWLFRRFDLSVATAGAFFFVAGLLSATSQLVSARLAARIGLIRTMVFTHLPANMLLIAAAFAQSAPVALGLLLGRMALAQMDVPARQAFVMSVVPPEERAAAASVTNVPRSLATALTPMLAGALFDRTLFGWPLVFAGAGKILYDLILLALFRSHERRDSALG